MTRRLVIFDCDGTLVDSEVIAVRVFPAYWSSLGVHFTEDEFKELFIGTGRDAQIVVETFARMPPDAEATGNRLLREVLKSELLPVPGMTRIISALCDDACVASNSSLAHIEQALELCGFGSRFAGRVFSAHNVPRPKPAPDLFLKAASSLGYLPQECVVVEDSPAGVRAAQAAGMKVIAFAGASHFVPSLVQRLKGFGPDWFCSDADELERCLLG